MYTTCTHPVPHSGDLLKTMINMYLYHIFLLAIWLRLNHSFHLPKDGPKWPTSLTLFLGGSKTIPPLKYLKATYRALRVIRVWLLYHGSNRVPIILIIVLIHNFEFFNGHILKYYYNNSKMITSASEVGVAQLVRALAFECQCSGSQVRVLSYPRWVQLAF